MEKIIILSNPGSASKKYSIYQDDIEIAWFHIEKISSGYTCSQKVGTTFEKIKVTDTEYHHACMFVVETLVNKKMISGISAITHIAIRTVIPDENYSKDMILTQDILDSLKTIVSYDPLHISPVLEEIEVVVQHLSPQTVIYLISDSTFHASASRRVPVEWEGGLRSIGYHGLSCESVLDTLSQQNIAHRKLVICHLGGGSSVSAVHAGQSKYNSMEYSPLGGVIMASRSGSIDPFIVLKYMKEKNLSPEELLTHLYTRSGLHALSGVSQDLRDIREQAFKGNVHAKDAIIQFVDSIVAHVCKAASYMQGIDTLVFTGTIGFRASYIREMVAEKLQWIGIHLNHDSNTQETDTCFKVSASDSRVKVYVIQIDEMKIMYTHVQKLISSKPKSKVY